ncbi:MAG TPA: glutathione S-transferase N-terminal domain-containing protein [Arenicellales bacterium]|nr:glutathione S-transferase N-terminal domain-containing protein [Arenicellales bacterium]
MKLRYSPTSPYVRKVMITAIETGQESVIEKVPTNPWDPETDLPDDNPLGKVPALIVDEGLTLFDSPVICEYLSERVGAVLVPQQGLNRWRVLRLQALGDGILDASVLRLLESRRPADKQSADWIERQKRTIARGIDSLEEAAAGWGDELTLGQITVGAALGYLDFRFPGDEWRQGRPQLTDWYEAFAQRASMKDTAPADPR